MKIGIIGAGNIGGNLTRRLTALGHDVVVSNSRGPETLADLAKETGATVVSAAEAARGADLVIVTVPERAIPSLPAGVLDGAALGAPVVDTGNYYPRQRDGRIDAIEDGTTESRWVSQQLGHPVVKAFNGIYAQHLLDRAGRRAHRGGSPYRSPGTTRRPRPSSCASSTSSASTRSTPGRSTSRGASSRALPSTAPTSTLRASGRP